MVGGLVRKHQRGAYTTGLHWVAVLLQTLHLMGNHGSSYDLVLNIP